MKIFLIKITRASNWYSVRKETPLSLHQRTDQDFLEAPGDCRAHLRVTCTLWDLLYSIP